MSNPGNKGKNSNSNNNNNKPTDTIPEAVSSSSTQQPPIIQPSPPSAFEEMVLKALQAIQATQDQQGAAIAQLQTEVQKRSSSRPTSPHSSPAKTDAAERSALEQQLQDQTSTIDSIKAELTVLQQAFAGSASTEASPHSTDTTTQSAAVDAAALHVPKKSIARPINDAPDFPRRMRRDLEEETDSDDEYGLSQPRHFTTPALKPRFQQPKKDKRAAAAVPPEEPPTRYTPFRASHFPPPPPAAPPHGNRTLVQTTVPVLSSAQQQQVVVNAPPFSHVLKSLHVKDVLCHKRQCYEYTWQYNIAVMVVSSLSPSLRNVLMNEYKPTMSLYDFNLLHDDEVWDMIRQSALPKNTVEFIKSLKKSVAFPDLSEYAPSVADFKLLYQATLTFTREFMETYEFLSIAKDHIPPLWTATKAPGGKTQEDTLISLYLSFFPHGSGPALHKLLIAKERPATIDAYTIMFTTNLCIEHKQSEEMHQLASIFRIWKKDVASRGDNSANHLHDDYSSDDELHVLANLGPNKPKGGCYLRLRGLHCPRGNLCPYSHNIAVLTQMRADTIAEMEAANYDEAKFDD